MLSEQVTTDTLPTDAPRQQDVVKEIKESNGVEAEPILDYPIANPAEFYVPIEFVSQGLSGSGCSKDQENYD